MSHLTDMLAHAATIAVVVVPTIEAIRKQVPSLDGWKVLVASFVASLGFAFIALRPEGTTGWADGVGIAVLATVVAVGGDSWVSKLAGKVRSP